MPRESVFQTEFIATISEKLPGSLILRPDPNYFQGILDRIILYKDRWAALEFKASSNSPHRPNQDYYVDLMNRMSYASFVYPENERVVLSELQSALQTGRSARFSGR